MSKKAIYLVGNSIVPKDAMPFKIKPFLQKAFPNIRFIPFDPTEDFPNDPHPIFIDTAINLVSPRLFTGASEFEPFSSRKLSVHDFDFYTELALREKLGEKRKYSIIGVPPKGDLLEIAQNVASIITSFY
ncbi:MAG: hypothetical protein HY564_03190 [Candidatus Jacksonbacteria bacterium]|nr:hypothetical protein [Candidatus Jacksonbacteria bacterium]